MLGAGLAGWLENTTCIWGLAGATDTGSTGQEGALPGESGKALPVPERGEARMGSQWTATRAQRPSWQTNSGVVRQKPGLPYHLQPLFLLRHLSGFVPTGVLKVPAPSAAAPPGPPHPRPPPAEVLKCCPMCRAGMRGGQVCEGGRHLHSPVGSPSPLCTVFWVRNANCGRGLTHTLPPRDHVHGLCQLLWNVPPDTNP